jgi:LPXTG-site transpeptidase (sortase) family protein
MNGAVVSRETSATITIPTTRPRRRWAYRLLIGGGVLIVAVAATWEIRAVLWTTHSERVGHSLVLKEERARRAAAKAAESGKAARTASACARTTTTTAASPGPEGLLVIPAIGLTAPVEEGTADAELDVAVGHLSTSALPGAAGNAVFEAHDVSYFVNIDQLKPGDAIRYETPCATYTYTVQSHQVIKQGSTLYNTPGPTLSLLTCWPTNALWFTPDRYLVTATESQSAPNTGKADVVGPVPASATPPTVPAPAPLAAQGLTLATNSVLMGTLTVTGQPDPSWVEGPGPLAVQDSAVESFIGATKALSQNELGWWDALAPGVTAPAPLVGSRITGYDASLDVSVTAAGGAATAVQLTDTATVTGGRAPGVYRITVDQTVSNGQLLITSWVLTPA